MTTSLHLSALRPVTFCAIAGIFLSGAALDAHAKRGFSGHSSSHGGSSSHVTVHESESLGGKVVSGAASAASRNASRSDSSERTAEAGAATAAPAGETARTAAPSAVDKALAEQRERQDKMDRVAAEQRRIDEERQKEEGNRKVQQEITERLKADQIAARKAAEAEAARERARLQEALERQCIIKPVMTNAEIATCKSVWR